MAISLKHAFTSPKADGTDSTLVQPSNWNAEHTITLAAGKVLGRDSSGAGTAQELPISVDTSGNLSLSATSYFLGASGTTAQRPGTATAGMFRFNTSLAKFEGYNGTSWAPVGGGGGTISDTAPAGPSAGDLWWNSSDGQLYIYYTDVDGSQWVVANAFTGGSAYLPLTGGTVTGLVTFSQTISATGNAYMQLDVLTDGATISPDFSVGNNFSVTLGGNRVLANPTNLTAGQSGIIYVSQDGTGSRTLSYGTSWKFPNGTAPTLTTTASAVDALVYTVRTTTSITVQAVLNIG